MTNIAHTGAQRAVSFLNKPQIKEGIKNIVGTITFSFGLVELYDIAQIVKDNAPVSETQSNRPKWIRIANKVIIACAKLSLILSAATSRPGVFLISMIAGRIFSSLRLNRLFGPNTTFAINPWHPRHVASIAALALALPSTIQSAYNGIAWTCQRIRCHRTNPEGAPHSSRLTDAKARLMSLFNTITSRPVLHIGNQLSVRFA